MEFTYDDYLKYKLYLQIEEYKERKDMYIHFSKEEKDRLVDQLLKLEKMLNEDEKVEPEEQMIMEESTQYIIENIDNPEVKNRLEESRKKHDELFRSLLNDKEDFIDFMKFFVDRKFTLTKEDLEKYNRNFVTKEYHSRTSDIIYKVKNKNIYFLVEHQSSVDYTMPYRMQEYSYEIIRDVVDKEKIKSNQYESLKVIPIVLYTGNKKWKVSKVIGIIRDGKYEDVGLRLKYILVDANEYSKEELLDSESIVGCAMFSEKSATDEQIVEALEKMLILKPNKREKIAGIINYIYKDILKEKELKFMEQKILNGEVKEAMITVRERIMKNNEKIFKRGMYEDRVIIVKNMIKFGMKKEEIHRATGISIKEIEKIEKHN